MSEKLLICLNDNVDFDFKLTYLGCRMIDSKYTLIKLVSSLLNNAIDGKSAILVVDENCRFYTASECYDLGLKFVNQCLKEYDEADEEFVFSLVNKEDENDIHALIREFLAFKIGSLISKSQRDYFCHILTERLLCDSREEGRLCLKDRRQI